MANFVDYNGNTINDLLKATTTSDGILSSEDKVKLNGIDTGANKTIIDSSLSTTSTNPIQNKVINTALNTKANSTDLASHVGNVTNPHNVTKSQIGLGNVENKSSATIRGELTKDNVITALGYTPPTQDTNTTYSNFVKSGTGAKAGLVPAPSTTAGITKYLREDGTWSVPPNNNTTYNVATTSANGLMSASDKTKLDGIATGANNYSHPSSHPASIITQDSNNRFVSDTEKATWNGKASSALASTTVNGLMSKEDKTKLDGIAAGANKITVDTAISMISSNPVQNKVISAALDGKASTTTLSSHTNNKNNPHSVTAAQVGAAATTHTHTASQISSGILPLTRGGTGQSSIDGLKSSLGLGLACSGYTSVISGPINANTVIKIPLDEFHDTTSDDVFQIYDGGIKVNRTGIILVSGSVEFAISSQNTVTCYVNDGGRIAVQQSVLLAQSGVVYSGSRVLRVTSGDVLYLHASAKTAANYAGVSYNTRLDIVFIA